ncbi:MAG: hypothetical protein AAFQ63_09045 [Cyanobacteria bacterium J06621_11]
MDVILGFVVFAIALSWASARVRGVPWMSWGTPTKMRTDKRRAQYQMRLRTKSIKPKSPWLEKSGPQSPWLSGAATGFGDAERTAFARLVSLTHSHPISVRTVKSLHKWNPEKTWLWCIEKAIYDIERDRMAR